MQIVAAFSGRLTMQVVGWFDLELAATQRFVHIHQMNQVNSCNGLP